MLPKQVLGGSKSIHIEAIDWHNRVVNNGGNVSSTTLKAVSDFCRSIDSAGIRSKFARLNLFCGNNLNACVVPLYRSLSYGGTLYGGSTDTNNNFISTDYVERGSGGGLTSNSSAPSKYVSTGLTDDILFSTITNNQDSHMSIYMNYLSTAVTTVMGTQDECNCYISRIFFGPPANNSLESYMNSDCGGNNYASGFATTSYGLVTNSCSGSSLNYYNGSSSLLSASTVSWSAPSPGLEIVVMGVSFESPDCSSSYQYGMDYTGTSCGYSIGKGLSGGEVATYNTIMTAFQRTLGRNA